MSLYPVNLDISGMRCLVVGGGSVASRKIASLLPCGAVLSVISPEVCPYIENLAGSGLLQWKSRGYKTGDLDDVKLVFAATNRPEIQTQIVKEARLAGIFTNVIDMPEACTFQVPASFRQGELLFTVSTAGGSPALAAQIKRDLEKNYGPEYGQLVAMMADLRKGIVNSNNNPVEHKRVFEKLINNDILECIREQRWSKLSTMLQQILPAEVNVLQLIERIQSYSKE
ncbi:MAG: bifunctional precorrin-2 dehydrogenase/sirohydrochlorin ferrochelatase [Desulfocapsa sp.]|nr:bifunctional precorrin-2 dehydrogenase/sirohydrochlorin ferrochelatase [Desulfocapsa sp.]